MSLYEKLEIKERLSEINECLSILENELDTEFDFKLVNKRDFISLKYLVGRSGVRYFECGVEDYDESVENNLSNKLENGLDIRLVVKCDISWSRSRENFDMMSVSFNKFVRKIEKMGYLIHFGSLGNFHEFRYENDFKKKYVKRIYENFKFYLMDIIELDKIRDVNPDEIPESKIMKYNEFIKKWSANIEMKKDLINLLKNED